MTTRKITIQAGAFIGILLLFITSCLDQIDLEIPIDNAESLVIQGKLVIGDPAQVEVKLSKLFNFTAEGKQPVNARKVLLLDEDNNEVELEDAGLGNYFLLVPGNHPTFKIELERNYFIRVETFDGRVFESAMEKASAVPQPESVDFQLFQREAIDLNGNVRTQEFLRFIINTPLRTSEAGEKTRLGWEYEYTYRVTDTPIEFGDVQKLCYITQNLNISDIRVVDADALSSDRLDNYELYETTVSRVFGEGLYFSAIQESLSETAYDYFTQVAENTGRTGNMFESPPGRVVSNVKNVNDETEEAFGFFYVTQQDTIRKFVNPELIGSPPALCPPPNGVVNEGGNCTEQRCCNCLRVDNSSLVKPDFWID